MADHLAGAPPATVNPSSPTSGSRERRELLSLPLCFVILEREVKEGYEEKNRSSVFISIFGPVRF